MSGDPYPRHPQDHHTSIEWSDSVKVEMKARITGTRDGVEWPELGQTLTVPDAEGADLCAAGLAVPVAQEPRKAVAAKPETRKRAAKK